MRIDGIIMASGLSARMGTNKLLLPYKGKALLQHVLDLVATLPLARRILVTTPSTASGIVLPEGMQLVINEHPERGQSSSVHLGLSQACGDAYLFFTADQPRLDKKTVERLLQAARPDRIVIPCYGDKPGNPVLFPAALRDELLALRGDTGGRPVIKAHADLCHHVQVDSLAVLADVDTPAQYQALLTETKYQEGTPCL